MSWQAMKLFLWMLGWLWIMSIFIGAMVYGLGNAIRYGPYHAEGKNGSEGFRFYAAATGLGALKGARFAANVTAAFVAVLAVGTAIEESAGLFGWAWTLAALGGVAVLVAAAFGRSEYLRRAAGTRWRSAKARWFPPKDRSYFPKEARDEAAA